MILFFALGGEILLRYRFTLGAPRALRAGAAQ
jgi:hypothetical protein